MQYTQSVTIPLLPLVPAVITQSGHQSKPPTKFSHSAHSSFLVFIYTFSTQQYQTFKHLLQPDVESKSTPHTFALTRKNIYGLIGSEPDTTRLNEAMK